MRIDSTVGDRPGQALPPSRTEQKDISTFAPAATASTTASAMEVAFLETGGGAGVPKTKNWGGGREKAGGRPRAGARSFFLGAPAARRRAARGTLPPPGGVRLT